MSWLNFLLNAVISGIVIFAARSIILHWIDKNITAYKSELQSIAFERQVRFTKLHEKRAEIISELYAQLDDTHRDLRSFLNPVQWGSDVTVNKKERVAEESANKLIRHYRRNKIFLPLDVCDLIEAIIKDIHAAWNIYEVYVKIPSTTSPNAGADSNKWFESFKIVENKIPPVKQKLEGELRRLLGDEKALPK